MHTGTGESVRVMETHQDWVAKLIRDKANESFRESGRPYVSRVVPA